MARVEMNPALGAELARSPAMLAMMQARVEAASQEAKAIAPVGDASTDPHPGRFRNSIHGEASIVEGRVIGRLSSDDPAAPYIIHGTSDTPAHDTLMRAVEATRR